MTITAMPGGTTAGRRRGRLWQGLLAIAALALLAPVPGAARPRPMTGDEAASLTAVGWFGRGPAPGAKGSGCTAVLVAPDLVLTATHCVSKDEATPPEKPRAFIFAPGWPKAGQGHIVRADDVILPPRRTLLDGTLPFDVALIRLRRAVPDTIARPLAIAPAARPQPVSITDLLGQDAPPAPAPDPVSAGPALPSGVTAVLYHRDAPDRPVLNDGCTLIRATGPVLEYGCRAQAGNSGAPLLVRAPGGDWQVLAITVARGTRPSPDAPPPQVGLYAVIPAPDLVARLPQP